MRQLIRRFCVIKLHFALRVPVAHAGGSAAAVEFATRKLVVTTKKSSSTCGRLIVGGYLQFVTFLDHCGLS